MLHNHFSGDALHYVFYTDELDQARGESMVIEPSYINDPSYVFDYGLTESDPEYTPAPETVRRAQLMQGNGSKLEDDEEDDGDDAGSSMSLYSDCNLTVI